MPKHNHERNSQISSLIPSLESCPIGDGDLVGQPFKVLPYQNAFLRRAFKPGVLRAGLSLARGGGKSGLASGPSPGLHPARRSALPASMLSMDDLAPVIKGAPVSDTIWHQVINNTKFLGTIWEHLNEQPPN